MPTAERIAAALALLLLASPAVRASQSSRTSVTATVVHSFRLQVAPRASMMAALAPSPSTTPLAAGSRPSVRAVPAAGGTYYVLGFDVAANDAGAPADIGLQVSPDESARAGQPEIRYHAGSNGAWNSRRFGTAVPSAAHGALWVALAASEGGQAGKAGEVGVFVSKDAPAREAFVVVTVMADAVVQPATR
jgi:hypothetical protein